MIWCKGSGCLAFCLEVSSQWAILAQVHHVGADNYAAKLMLEAKTVKPINSRIMKSLDRLAGFTGKIIIPFGLALLLEALMLKRLASQIIRCKFIDSPFGNVA